MLTTLHEIDNDKLVWLICVARPRYQHTPPQRPYRGIPTPAYCIWTSDLLQRTLLRVQVHTQIYFHSTSGHLSSKLHYVFKIRPHNRRLKVRSREH